MDSSYLGGVLTRPAMEQRRGANPTALAGDECWWNVAGDRELFLRLRGGCFRLFTWDTLVLLVRGYARPAGSAAPLDLERVAEEVRAHYLEHGDLAVDGLDGSFTLALLDGQARRVLLYRNIVGAGFTYYRAVGDGLLFGSNLADLVDAVGDAARANAAALPSFFLYRTVPGRETLFDGFYRLLPGEQLAWDEGGLTRTQRHTFADLTAPSRGGDYVEELEATAAAVLRDCAAHRPRTANLLSGGVDSSYLQAVWNRVAPRGDSLPASYAVSVDHPRSWADTDYSVTAARALGTRHTLLPADTPYATYLLETLAATGEPPNHVQTAYFGRLARGMVEQGSTSGLCGEGADSLFGLELADDLINARRVRRFVPGRALRRHGASLADRLGLAWPARALRLADHVDDETHRTHPVNQVARFTEVEAVAACFGRHAVSQAAAGRRALLDRFRVPADPLDRLHAAGFLGEAMDSASLWTTLFHGAGADLLCPYLDSRLIRFALNLPRRVRYRRGRPKHLIKRALARHVPRELAERRKLGFGQPIFEWLGRGGPLRRLVERIEPHDFLDPAALAGALARPGWFLYSLLCYDLWHKLFVARSLPRPAAPAAGGAPVFEETPLPSLDRQIR
jgi:asparagine synthase (glutamine-hydrolysing)